MRGKRAPKRKILPDPKYQNILIAKFINTMMHGGKKATAQRVMYQCLRNIKEETGEDPVTVFETAVKNVGPLVEIRSRRIGGANYQIPIPVRAERRQALAFRWIIQVTRDRKGKSMAVKLAQEFIDASKNTGSAMKKRQDVHRMAESNRAFAHFAR